MGLAELLDRIREQYVARLAGVAKEFGQRPNVRVLSEVALRHKQGDPVGEGILGLPMRLDLVTVCGDEVTERVSVDSGSMQTFKPITFAWDAGLQVTLNPFHWDSAAIHVPAPGEDANWRPLVHWFRKWFRSEEDGSGETLLGVIHFLSDPETANGVTRFTADLGSAPIQAFEELLDAIVHMGVTKVVIGDDRSALETKSG
jgi:hypothetical protein